MPEYNSALFLYNGNAGSEDIEEKLARTVPVLSRHIKAMTIIQTGSIEEAKETCVEFSAKIDLLIILGGDGTVHACINAISPLKKRPVIGILPAGTANDFSRTLQMPQNLHDAAQAIVEGDVINVDIGKTKDRYFLNFWGIGLVADTSQNIDEEQKKSWGVLSYFISTIRTVNQVEAFEYEIIDDENTFQGEAVLLIVLNGKFLGTREIPIPSIRANDGHFDVLLVKDSTLTSFMELLSMNNPNTDEEQFTELEHFQAKELKISTFPEKDIDMDGEISGTTPDEIALLPGHLRMIQGVDES